MFFSDDQEDYIFRPQLHLDSKWLNPDLQESFQDSDVLFELYNGLLLDREVYFSAGNGLVNSAGVTSRLGDSGKYYCGLRILTCTCCDGLCGPHSGCACEPCTELATDEQLRLTRNCKVAPRPAPSQVIDDLKWKIDPGPECLQSLLESLIWDQRMRAIKAVASNSYICQVRAFIAICHRHLVAVIRHRDKLKEERKIKLENKTTQESGTKMPLSSAVATLEKTSDVANAAEDLPDHSESTLGLARVGARAALRLALSLVRRAWRCGEDADVCSALLRDALDAVRALPDAALYAGADVASAVPRSQKIWAEVVDSAAKFLYQVVNGELGCNVPVGDWRTSLCVWVELCARRAELPALLKAADMLLSLPQKQRRIENNKVVIEDCMAPLGPFLRRMARVAAPRAPAGSEAYEGVQDTNTDHTAEFLKSCELPAGDGLMAVRQAGIALMCHINRLAAPLLPPMKGFSTCTDSAQEVISVGSGHIPLGAVRVNQIACGEKQALLLTQDGVVYALPYETMSPQLVPGLENTVITQIACHGAGRHYLCLSGAGCVYSWGCGDDGRLGLGDTAPRDAAMPVPGLAPHEAQHVIAGPATSAVISTRGALYTWGRGAHPRLGHGTLESCLTPQLVSLNTAHAMDRVVDVALGWGESQTLVCTQEGAVQVFGDSEGGAPRALASLSILKVVRVYTGEDWHAVLTDGGQVYTWGRGDNYQLGHGNVESIRLPKMVEALQGIRVVSLSLGASHGVALTSDGMLYAWGTHERSNIVRPIPQPLAAISPSFKIQGVSSGPLILVWSEECPRNLPQSLPFVIDLSIYTFRFLDKLLRMVVEQGLSKNATVLTENECIGIACLNILRLQVYAHQCAHGKTVTNDFLRANPWTHGVLQSLIVLVEGRAGAGAAAAAKKTLAAAWPMLMPTPQVRARHLLTLLPMGKGTHELTSGGRFMVELLVWSLLGGGGLRAALTQALQENGCDCYKHLLLDTDYDQIDIMTGQCVSKTDDADEQTEVAVVATTQETYEPKVKKDAKKKPDTVPLLTLVQQLIVNTTSRTQQQMRAVVKETRSKEEEAIVREAESIDLNMVNPCCELLIRFQRLLFCEAMCTRGELPTRGGIRKLFTLYARMLAAYVGPTIRGFSDAAKVMEEDTLETLCNIMMSDVVGRVLTELGPWLCACATRSPTVLMLATAPLLELARMCDLAASALPQAVPREADILAWTGCMARPKPRHKRVITAAELNNHAKDGPEPWLAFNGFVYDISNFTCECPATVSLVAKFRGHDATLAFSVLPHSAYVTKLTENCVGEYTKHLPKDAEIEENPTIIKMYHMLSSIAFQLTLAVSACGARLAQSLPAQPAELAARPHATAVFLRHGLKVRNPPNPFEEEKAEARSGTSSANHSPATEVPKMPPRPMVMKKQLPGKGHRPVQRQAPRVDVATASSKADALLQALAEPKLLDPLAIHLWTACERREGCAPHFPPEHPLEELRRSLLAALIHHAGLKEHALATASAGE